MAKLRAIIIASLGSETEQESVFRGLGIINEVFQLYQTPQRKKEAYTVGVNIGILDDALQLLIDKHLIPSVPQADLVDIFHYLQAGRLLAQVDHEERITAGLRTPQISVADKLWKNLIKALNDYLQFGTWPDRSSFQDGTMRGFLDLIVCDPWEIRVNKYREANWKSLGNYENPRSSREGSDFRFSQTPIGVYHWSNRYFKLYYSGKINTFSSSALPWDLRDPRPTWEVYYSAMVSPKS